MKKYRGEPTPLYLAAYVGGSSLESGKGQGPSEHTGSAQGAINHTDVCPSSSGLPRAAVFYLAPQQGRAGSTHGLKEPGDLTLGNFARESGNILLQPLWEVLG